MSYDAWGEPPDEPIYEDDYDPIELYYPHTITCTECGDVIDEDEAIEGCCVPCAHYIAQANAN